MDALLVMLCQYLRKQSVYGRTSWSLEEIQEILSKMVNRKFQYCCDQPCEYD